MICSACLGKRLLNFWLWFNSPALKLPFQEIVLLLLFLFNSPLHKSPWRFSYLLMMLRQRPSSLRISATSCRSAAFSRSRKAARTDIWFSLRRRASRDRFAASLFFTRRFQYFSSFSRWKEGQGRGGQKKKMSDQVLVAAKCQDINMHIFTGK